MPFATKYVLVVNMDIDADKEDLFNEIYDAEHAPDLLSVPGVISATRLKAEPLTMNRKGELRPSADDGVLTYSVVYEIESPAVLLSAEWAEKAEAGRWAEEVRPYTKNRHYELRKVIWTAEKEATSTG